MSEKYPSEISHFNEWLAGRERGLSSEAIVERLTGVPVSGRYGGQRSSLNYPHDPSDFRRCEMLLRQVVVASIGFPLMADVSPEWKVLVENWSALVAIGEAENPDIFTTRARGDASNLYARMRELLDGVREMNR